MLWRMSAQSMIHDEQNVVWVDPIENNISEKRE